MLSISRQPVRVLDFTYSPKLQYANLEVKVRDNLRGFFPEIVNPRNGKIRLFAALGPDADRRQNNFHFRKFPAKNPEWPVTPGKVRQLAVLFEFLKQQKALDTRVLDTLKAGLKEQVVRFTTAMNTNLEAK